MGVLIPDNKLKLGNGGEWEEEQLLRAHLPCPDCGSHDALSIYTKHSYCFSCKKWTPLGPQTKREGEGAMAALDYVQNLEYKDIPSRHLTEATCRKYGYGIGEAHGQTVQVAQYYDDKGKLRWQKLRTRDKKFCIRGKALPVFFGQNLFSGGRKLIITEGEIDCLSVSQAQDNKYPVVSIPNGVSSAAEVFKRNLKWLANFEEVIVMFDSDDAGKEAVKSICGILPPHKLKIATIAPYKDANDALLDGHPDAIIRAIWNASEYRPEGIVNAKELKTALFEDEEELESFEFPWCEGLTKMTQGIRRGEMLLLTAGSGIGKSTMARELAYDLKTKHGAKIGMIMLEESPKTTVRNLLSIHCKKPLHLSWNNKDTRAIAEAHYDELFSDGKIVLYDHFGACEGKALLDMVRYLIVAEGCEFVVLDHITIAATALDNAGSANERQVIDALMTSLRSVVEETGAGMIIISHLRKTDNHAVAFERGGMIGLDDLRGSGSLKQLPDTILAIERNQQAEDKEERNRLKLRVLKCRFTGQTGLAGYIKFNNATNRIEDVDEMEIETQSTPTDEDF